MSKMTKLFIATAFASVLCVSCNKGNPSIPKDKKGAVSETVTDSVDYLIGDWERYGDDKIGMTVTVSPYGDVMTSKIIINVSPLYDLGFNTGDMKWKSIKKVSPGKYSLTDMYKGGESGPTNLQGEIVVDTVKGLLTLTCSDDATKIQYWRKIDCELVTYKGAMGAEGYVSKSEIAYNAKTGHGIMTCDYGEDNRVAVTLDRGVNDGKTITFLTNGDSFMKFNILGDSIKVDDPDYFAQYGIVK